MSTPDQGSPRPGRGRGAATLRARIEQEGFAGLFGEDAYRAYMRSLRQKAPRDLAAIGGRACHRSLLEQLGEDGYRERQRAGFKAACAKHGAAKIKGHIAKAHEERRRWRLENPTRAERALQQLLRELGFTIHPLTHDPAYRYGAGDTRFRAGDVLLEARVGRYLADALIPALNLIIEVDGGVHKLRRTYDDERRQWLQATLGMVVHTFTNEQVLSPQFREILAELLCSA